MLLDCKQLREELFHAKRHKDIFDLYLQDFKLYDDHEHRKRLYMMKREVEVQIKYIRENIFNPEKVKKDLARFLALTSEAIDSADGVLVADKVAEKMINEHAFTSENNRLIIYNNDIRMVDVIGTKFPEHVAIANGKSLNFGKCTDLHLPDNFLSYGDVAIRNSSISSMSTNMHVGGSLSIDKCSFDKLPKFIKANSLALFGKNIDRLPTLDVFGALNIANTNVAELPNGLDLQGILCIKGTLITRLPDDLRVQGGLIIDKRLEAQAEILKQKGQVKHYEFQ